MSRRGLEVWRFFGDPAPLARDSIYLWARVKTFGQAYFRTTCPMDKRKYSVISIPVVVKIHADGIKLRILYFTKQNPLPQGLVLVWLFPSGQNDLYVCIQLNFFTQN